MARVGGGCPGLPGSCSDLKEKMGSDILLQVSTEDFENFSVAPGERLGDEQKSSDTPRLLLMGGFTLQEVSASTISPQRNPH